MRICSTAQVQTASFSGIGAGPGGRANYQPMWNALRRLGHREEILEWIQAGEPALGDWTNPLLALGDWDMTVIAPG